MIPPPSGGPCSKFSPAKDPHIDGAIDILLLIYLLPINIHFNDMRYVWLDVYRRNQTIEVLSRTAKEVHIIKNHVIPKETDLSIQTAIIPLILLIIAIIVICWRKNHNHKILYIQTSRVLIFDNFVCL